MSALLKKPRWLKVVVKMAELAAAMIIFPFFFETTDRLGTVRTYPT